MVFMRCPPRAPVQNAVLVAVRQPPHELKEEEPQAVHVQAALDLVQILAQIEVQEFKDERELLLRVHDVVEAEGL